MLQSTLTTKLRHLIKRIPGVETLWHNSRLLLAPSYREDGLCTNHNADFTRNARFVEAYEAALQRQSGIHIRWRVHVAIWAAKHAALRPGHFVECGVNRAFISTAVMSALDFKSINDRQFYLFDTYRGLVPELVSPEDKAAHYNEYTDVYEDVCAAFEDYSNVHVVQGIVPEVLNTVDIDRVAYLSIDMNCELPERAALEFFWDKLTPGAVVLLDDYGWRGHEAQKQSADSFASSKGAPILSLPTGQGLLLKP